MVLDPSRGNTLGCAENTLSWQSSYLMYGLVPLLQIFFSTCDDLMLSCGQVLAYTVEMSVIAPRMDLAPGSADRIASKLGDGDGARLSYPGWESALGRLRAVIGRGEAAILIGLPGVGKTAMLAVLAADAAAQLPRKHRRCPPAPALVDDAERLLRDDFSALLRSSAAVVLAGQHALVERLGNQRRAVTVVELSPVQPEDWATLLGTMLQQAGESPSLLPPEVSFPLGLHAGGRAGKFVALAQFAIFLARLEGVTTVEVRHVEEAAAISTGVVMSEPTFGFAPVDENGAEDEVRPRFLSRARTWLIAVPAVAAFFTALPRQTAIELPPASLAAPMVSTPALPLIPSPAAPAAALMPPFPSPMLHVGIIVPGNDVPALTRGQQVANILRQAGYTVGQLTVVAGLPPTGGVHYFYVTDQVAAGVLAATLGYAGSAFANEPIRTQTARSELRPGSAEFLVPASNLFPTRRDATSDQRRVP